MSARCSNLSMDLSAIIRLTVQNCTSGQKSLLHARIRIRPGSGISNAPGCSRSSSQILRTLSKCGGVSAAKQRNLPNHQRCSHYHWTYRCNRQNRCFRNNWIKVQSQFATISTTADYVFDMVPFRARHRKTLRRRRTARKAFRRMCFAALTL